MKKLLLTLGTLSAIVAPITAVVACSDDVTTTPAKTNEKINASIITDATTIKPKETLADAASRYISRLDDRKPPADLKADTITKLKAAKTFKELSNIFKDFGSKLEQLEAAKNSAAGAIEMKSIDDKHIAVKVYSSKSKNELSALKTDEIKTALGVETFWSLIGVVPNDSLKAMKADFTSWDRDNLILVEDYMGTTVTVTVVPKA